MKILEILGFWGDFWGEWELGLELDLELDFGVGWEFFVGIWGKGGVGEDVSGEDVKLGVGFLGFFAGFLL